MRPSCWPRRATLALLLFAVTLASLPGPNVAQAADGMTQPPVRALWVDAFHEGFKSPAQIERLVADARRANLNTLLVQVRRRGDVYYLGGPEPLAADVPPGFDALRALLQAAHRGSPRLEVQAWLAVYPVWGNRDTPPADPNHPFNLHGPNAIGEDNWLMQRQDGETWTGEAYWFDPGHPAVQSYLVDLATDLVRRYDVDGLHLDRLRYHQGSREAGGLDRRWGYNSASAIRFDLENGRIGQPDQDDPLWAQFRRDRVTELLRCLRESTQAVRPGLKISAAVIPWGAPPATAADWTRSAAYAYVFQDWQAWLREGLLDQAFPMNYNRESVPQQAEWQERWFTWLRANAYGRQVVPGLAVYLNDPADSLRQVRRALAPGPDGSRLAGVALYSYAVPDPSRGNDDPADDSADGYLWDLLARPQADNDYNPPFPEPVAAAGTRPQPTSPRGR